jgi:hypothetical protein
MPMPAANSRIELARRVPPESMRVVVGPVRSQDHPRDRDQRDGQRERRGEAREVAHQPQRRPQHDPQDQEEREPRSRLARNTEAERQACDLQRGQPRHANMTASAAARVVRQLEI